MDKASSLTDAYVEIKFGEDYQFKTQIIKKTLNPHFNQQFRLEVTSDKYIQDNIIELKGLLGIFFVCLLFYCVR